VDERCEFSAEDYSECEVDILRGYKKREGIEIATRTMSPEVLCVDEISGEDGASIAGVVRCGIPIIATSHASSRDELFSKSSLLPLFDCGVFDVFVGISRTDGTYSLSVDRL
jgi:stage III sporulation protein AA